MFSAVHPLLKPVLVAAIAVTLAFWFGAFLERSLNPRPQVPICPQYRPLASPVAIG